MVTLDGSDLLLAGHICAGITALAAGPATLATSRLPRWHRASLATYYTSVAVLNTTAIGLVLAAPARLWWLTPIALATQAAVIGGWRLGQRSPGVTPAQVRLMGGSYVSLITAVAVVSWGGPLSWALPSAIGFLCVETAAARVGHSVGAGRRTA